MTNYQLYRTNVLLGGQMKYDLILEPRYNGGQTIINDFHISPISKKVPYAKYVVDNLLNYPHVENIKKFYEKTRSSFYKSYTDPILESDAFLPLDYNGETSETTYEMGCRRVSQRLYGKQFEFLCPVWIEQIDDINQLEFEFQVCVNDKQTKPLYIRRVSFDGNAKLRQYFNNYIQDSVKLNTGIDWVFSINKDKCQVNGLDVQNGIYKTIEMLDLWSTLSSRERPLLEFNNMIINKLNAYNLITPQLFNFNLCFNYEDILNPYLYSELHKHPIYINVVVRLKGEALEIRDIFSNHEYLDKPYLHLPKLELNSNNQLEVTTQNSGENLLNYLNDDKCYTLINKNKILQNTCHWRYSSGSNSHFNLYNGFSSIFKSQNGQIINVPYYNEEVCNIKYDGSNMNGSMDQTYILNYPYWCNNYDFDFDSDLQALHKSIPELFLNNQYKHLWSTFYPGCIQKGVRYQNSDDQTDTHVDVLSFYTIPIDMEKVKQEANRYRRLLSDSHAVLTDYLSRVWPLGTLEVMNSIYNDFQDYIGIIKQINTSDLQKFSYFLSNEDLLSENEVSKYEEYAKAFMGYCEYLRSIDHVYSDGEGDKDRRYPTLASVYQTYGDAFNLANAVFYSGSMWLNFETQAWEWILKFTDIPLVRGFNQLCNIVIGTNVSNTYDLTTMWKIGDEIWQPIVYNEYDSSDIHEILSPYHSGNEGDNLLYLASSCQKIDNIFNILDLEQYTESEIDQSTIENYMQKMQNGINYIANWKNNKSIIDNKLNLINNLQFDDNVSNDVNTFIEYLNGMSIPHMDPTSILNMDDFERLYGSIDEFHYWVQETLKIFDKSLYGSSNTATKDSNFENKLLTKIKEIYPSITEEDDLIDALKDIQLRFENCRANNIKLYQGEYDEKLIGVVDAYSLVKFLTNTQYIFEVNTKLQVNGKMLSPLAFKLNMFTNIYPDIINILFATDTAYILMNIASDCGLYFTDLTELKNAWLSHISKGKRVLTELNNISTYYSDISVGLTFHWRESKSKFEELFNNYPDWDENYPDTVLGPNHYGKRILEMVYQYSQLIHNVKFTNTTTFFEEDLPSESDYKTNLNNTIFDAWEGSEHILDRYSTQALVFDAFKNNSIEELSRLSKESNISIDEISKILDEIKANYNTIDYIIRNDLLIIYQRDPADNKVNKILFWNIIKSSDELYLPFKTEMLYKNFIKNMKEMDIQICNDLLNILNKPTTDLQQSIVFLNGITPYKVNSPSLNTTEIDYYKHKFNTPTTIFRELGKIKPYFVEPTNIRYRNYQYSKVPLNDENVDGKYFATPYSPKYPSINYFPLKSEPVQYVVEDDKSKNEYHHYTSNKIINLSPEYDIEYRTKDETKFDINDYIYQFLKGEYMSILNDENISDEILTQRLNYIANQYKLEKSIIDTEVVDDEIQMVYKIKIKLK